MFAYLTVLALGIAASANLVPAQQHDKAEAISVEHPWARETPPTVTNGAAYMVIVKKGKEMDRLVGISGKVAERIELHTHLLEDEVIKMRPIEAIEVHPSEPTVLRPSGLHIMLIDLKEPLVAGQQFFLTLQFEKAGELSVAVTVRKPEAIPKGDQHKHHP